MAPAPMTLNPEAANVATILNMILFMVFISSPYSTIAGIFFSELIKFPNKLSQIQ